MIDTFDRGANRFKLWIDEMPFRPMETRLGLYKSIEHAVHVAPPYRSVILETLMSRGSMVIYGLLGVLVETSRTSGALTIRVAKDCPDEGALELPGSIFRGTPGFAAMKGFMPGYNEIALQEMVAEFESARLAFQGTIDIAFWGYSPVGTSPNIVRIMAKALPYLLFEPKIEEEKVYELVAAPTYRSDSSL